METVGISPKIKNLKLSGDMTWGKLDSLLTENGGGGGI